MIHERHHCARRDLQSVGHRLLRLPVSAAHRPEQGVVTWLEAERADNLAEPAAGRQAKLGQHEANARPAVDGGDGTLIVHEITLQAEPIMLEIFVSE